MAVWSLDTAHSQVQFGVKHMMVTTVRGRFDRFEVAVDFDEAEPARSSVVAHIDASSIDTGTETRDTHLRSADFFDVERYPLVVFRSTSIVPKGGQAYAIAGDLTIKDVTRPVTLAAEIEGVVPDLSGGRRAAFSATTRISRKEWGLSWNIALESGGWLVGDEIRISVELSLVEAAIEVERETVGA